MNNPGTIQTLPQYIDRLRSQPTVPEVSVCTGHFSDECWLQPLFAVSQFDIHTVTPASLARFLDFIGDDLFSLISGTIYLLRNGMKVPNDVAYDALYKLKVLLDTFESNTSEVQELNRKLNEIIKKTEQDAKNDELRNQKLKFAFNNLPRRLYGMLAEFLAIDIYLREGGDQLEYAEDLNDTVHLPLILTLRLQEILSESTLDLFDLQGYGIIEFVKRESIIQKYSYLEQYEEDESTFYEPATEEAIQKAKYQRKIRALPIFNEYESLLQQILSYAPTTECRGNWRKFSRWLYYLVALYSNINRNIVCQPHFEKSLYSRDDTVIAQDVNGELLSLPAGRFSAASLELLFVLFCKLNNSTKLKECKVHLIAPDNLQSELTRCSDQGTRLILVPLTILTGDNLYVGHANVCVFDLLKHTVERFEPHGAVTSKDYDLTSLLDRTLERYFSDKVQPAYKYVTPNALCPTLTTGPQAKQARNIRPECKKGGFCVTYSMLYAHLRLRFPDADPSQIIEMWLATTTSRDAMLDLIQRYQTWIDTIVPDPADPNQAAALAEFDDDHNFKSGQLEYFTPGHSRYSLSKSIPSNVKHTVNEQVYDIINTGVDELESFWETENPDAFKKLLIQKADYTNPLTWRSRSAELADFNEIAVISNNISQLNEFARSDPKHIGHLKQDPRYVRRLNQLEDQIKTWEQRTRLWFQPTVFQETLEKAKESQEQNRAQYYTMAQNPVPQAPIAPATRPVPQNPFGSAAKPVPQTPIAPAARALPQNPFGFQYNQPVGPAARPQNPVAQPPLFAFQYNQSIAPTARLIPPNPVPQTPLFGIQYNQPIAPAVILENPFQTPQNPFQALPQELVENPFFR